MVSLASWDIPPWQYNAPPTSMATGPDAPTTGQAVVISKATVNPLAHRSLTYVPDGDEWTYPKGDLACFDAQQCDLAFTSDDITCEREVMSSDIGLVVFTHFGGRGPSHPGISFRGVVSTGGSRGATGGNMDLGIKTSGTVTVMNTGKATIPEGSLVMWQFPPRNADLWPKRRGRPAGKCVPELVAWDGRRVGEQWFEYLKLARTLKGSLFDIERGLRQLMQRYPDVLPEALAPLPVTPMLAAGWLAASPDSMPATVVSYLTAGEEPYAAHYEPDDAPAYIARCMGDHYNRMRARVVGTALSTSVPGRDLHLLLGMGPSL